MTMDSQIDEDFHWNLLPQLGILWQKHFLYIYDNKANPEKHDFEETSTSRIQKIK